MTNSHIIISQEKALDLSKGAIDSLEKKMDKIRKNQWAHIIEVLFDAATDRRPQETLPLNMGDFVTYCKRFEKSSPTLPNMEYFLHIKFGNYSNEKFIDSPYFYTNNVNHGKYMNYVSELKSATIFHRAFMLHSGETQYVSLSIADFALLDEWSRICA